MNEPLPESAYEKLLETGRPLVDGEAPPVTNLGKYRLVREIGRGGMGIVYEATDTELDRRVALKLLRERLTSDSAVWQRFQREARTVAKFSHPNIATVHEARDSFIVMQFIDGVTIGELSNRDPRALVRLMRDAARAVHHAHEHGVIHRDIKPHNLMVDRSGERLYVMDFGLAKQTEVDSSLSHSGHLIGTPGYMSPEQARGKVREIHATTDVYSLGATLYELLGGQPPFAAKEVYEILKMVVEDDATPLRQLRPDVERDLETIVAKCMEKDPGRRYASAGELADDLTRWLDGHPVLAQPPTTAYRIRKFVSRRRAVVIAAGVGLLAVILLLAYLLPMLRRESRDKITANRALLLWGQLSGLLADAELYRRGADLLRSDRKLDEGIRICQTAIEEEGSADAYFFLGRLLHARGDLLLAREALDSALERNPALGEARHERGLLLVDMYGSTLSMHRELFMVNRSDPKPPMYNVEQLETMFPFYRMIRNLAIADLSVEIGSSSYFKRVDALYGKAELARILGNHRLAHQNLGLVLEEEPLYVRALQSRAMLALAEENWDAAIEAAALAIDRHRGFAPARVARGLATFWKLEDVSSEEEAKRLRARGLADCKEALQLDPENADARLGLGNFLLEGGEIDGAIREYTRAIEIDGRRAHAFGNRGLARARKAGGIADPEMAISILDAAIDDFSAAQRINHQLPAPYRDRGTARAEKAKRLGSQGKSAESEQERSLAIADFNRGMEAAMDHPAFQEELRSRIQEIR